MPDLQSELKRAQAQTLSITKPVKPVTPERTRARSRCEGIHVKQLADMVGVKAAAKAIGFSESGLSNILNDPDKGCSVTADVAAQGVMLHLEIQRGVRREMPTLILMQVPADKVGAVRTVIEAMNVKYDVLNKG